MHFGTWEIGPPHQPAEDKCYELAVTSKHGSKKKLTTSSIKAISYRAGQKDLEKIENLSEFLCIGAHVVKQMSSQGLLIQMRAVNQEEVEGAEQ